LNAIKKPDPLIASLRTWIAPWSPRSALPRFVSNAGVPEWLKAALAQRFSVPVKYVIYSHSHFDHGEGGAVFRDTATFIAHEGVATNMDGTPLDEWIRSYKNVYALDFEIFAGGHGAFFSKQDVAEPIRFLEDLAAKWTKQGDLPTNIPNRNPHSQ
jgi:glyoxylase-like metal-dependent hydrolase (beta-lactamase superfamily II)